MQEARELQCKLRRASNDEERRVISQELEITQTKSDLAYSRQVYKTEKLNLVIILIQAIVCHELSTSAVQYGYILI